MQHIGTKQKQSVAFLKIVIKDYISNFDLQDNYLFGDFSSNNNMFMEAYIHTYIQICLCTIA